jgi:hypothetical protein
MVELAATTAALFVSTSTGEGEDGEIAADAKTVNYHVGVDLILKDGSNYNSPSSNMASVGLHVSSTQYARDLDLVALREQVTEMEGRVADMVSAYLVMAGIMWPVSMPPAVEDAEKLANIMAGAATQFNLAQRIAEALAQNKRAAAAAERAREALAGLAVTVAPTTHCATEDSTGE